MTQPPLPPQIRLLRRITEAGMATLAIALIANFGAGIHAAETGPQAVPQPIATDANAASLGGPQGQSMGSNPPQPLARDINPNQARLERAEQQVNDMDLNATPAITTSSLSPMVELIQVDVR